MELKDASGEEFYCLPDNARCIAGADNPENMDTCPLKKFDDFGFVCVPSECEQYTENNILFLPKTNRKRKKTFEVSSKLADKINHYLSVEPKVEKECLPENKTLAVTVSFPGGIEMDIKCRRVRFQEGKSNLPWTEAVLFDHGHEVCCSESSDSFLGEWTLEYKGTEYTAIIKKAKEKTNFK